MLQDLESALAHQPFGLMEFEDVYSVSDDAPPPEDNLTYDPAAAAQPLPVEEPAVQPAYEPEPPVDLREEIAIPDTAPDAPALQPDAGTQEEYVTPAAPTGKKPKKPKKLFGGKFLLAVVLVVCLLVLLIYSVATRMQTSETATTVAPEAIAAIAPLIGGFGYGIGND